MDVFQAVIYAFTRVVAVWSPATNMSASTLSDEYGWDPVKLVSTFFTQKANTWLSKHETYIDQRTQTNTDFWNWQCSSWYTRKSVLVNFVTFSTARTFECVNVPENRSILVSCMVSSEASQLWGERFEVTRTKKLDKTSVSFELTNNCARYSSLVFLLMHSFLIIVRL